MAKGINEFKVGDWIEQCLNPKDEHPTWGRWAVIHDSQGAAFARELVATDGACLGTYTAAFVARGEIWPFRTRTPKVAEVLEYINSRIVETGDHYHNKITGQPIGPRG